MLGSKIKKIIMEIRWLLLPLYLGLGLSMVAFVVKFFQELMIILSKMITANESDLLLSVLSLIDIVLVANLLVMVIISGYETFISPIKTSEKGTGSPGWLSKLDPGTVKIKLASSVVGISLVKLLSVYMKLEDYSQEKIMWSVIIHVTFLFSAIFLAMVDKLSVSKPGGR
ncbi:MAG: TIGR00645 family protein [Alphaproteobacteria bacterium]|nr:TIGR00645 family protein [Alphaproteobacteria bacterium]OJV46621.1 MAG: TIGR00645 family protein [Alphaproteobacteria bacterium 43-37]